MRAEQLSLPQKIATLFNEGELKTLCYDLGIDYDQLPGDGTANKTREIVLYFTRRAELDQLLRYCEDKRPNADWAASLNPASLASSGSFASLAPRDVDAPHAQLLAQRECGILPAATISAPGRGERWRLPVPP